MRTWWVLAVGLAAGCGDDEDPEAFAEDYAEIWCDRQEECALGEFQREFTSLDDCRIERADDPHLPDDDQGCPVDPERAEACLEYLHDTDCAGFDKDDIEDVCRDVFAC